MLPALYAHRLGRAYGPDSSLAALHRTIQQPLDGLETDCCLTADGELVLLHDPLLDLGTTASGWAHQRTAMEIRAGWAAQPRRHTKRRAPAAARRTARARAARREAPARGQSARRPSPRTPHRASRLRASSRPPSAGADRGHQLLVR
ncbi:MAG: glycerophosphodiester phosphodiesterase [Solirubrobacteraceae bacterium]